MMRTESTDRRFSRHPPNEGRVASSITLQRKLAETRRTAVHSTNQTPDLTDFMNDMFFGTINGGDHIMKRGNYNLTGGGGGGGRDVGDRDDDDFDSSIRSVSSRQTQEWLDEAKRMVASSPSRGGDSPSSRLVVSPRFAAAQGRFSTSSLDKRDPLSRSARRHRAMEGFSGEILSKTAMHTRNRSETNLDPPQPNGSPGSEVHKWVSDNLRIPNNSPDPTISPDPTPPSPTSSLVGPPLPPRQSIHRRSRFQTEPKSPAQQQIPSPTPAISLLPKRNFKTTPNNNSNIATNTILEAQLLSPPKHLVESGHRRSVSSSTCSAAEPDQVLSPPRNLVESAHRRSVSSNTCRNERVLRKDVVDEVQLKNGGLKDQELNVFLKEQRVRIGKLLSGEIDGKAKIVLSGPSNSTSSMVAATCYAWLWENKLRANKKGGRNDRNMEFVVPVMNIRRGKMWKQHQAAWLFHHVGLDATSLLFSNEVELETLMMAKQLSIHVVGEDILKTNGEVGSSCTVLTDNYCEDAYDLLQTPILKKLLLAGILLDTQNLSPSPKLSMTRDAEAVQLLSVASAPNYRNTLFDKLMQDQRDNDFFEVLSRTYGRPPSDVNWEIGTPTEHKTAEKIPSREVIAPRDDRRQKDTNDVRTKKVSPSSGIRTASPVQPPAKAPAKANSVDESRGKNNNFFAKLFGFGSRK